MKSSRIVQLAIFAMVVFCDAETEFASPIYSFTTIDVPGASETFAEGINNSGQIVGIYYVTPTSLGQGFLDTGGSFTTINFPGGLTSGASAINDSGQILGEFGGNRGYLATPAAVPEPPSSLTLSTCLVALSGIVWCRKKRASAGNRH